MSGRLLRIQDWEKLARESNFQPGLMAAKCPIGLRQLERFFAKHFNKAPKAWTRELQLGIARDRLSQGWSNKAVVEELGFANESHFCHVFKKFYGASPQTFAPLYGRGDVKVQGKTIIPNEARGTIVGATRIKSHLNKNVAFRQFG